MREIHFYLMILLLMLSPFCIWVLLKYSKLQKQIDFTDDRRTLIDIIVAFYMVITPTIVGAAILYTLDYFKLLFWKTY